MIKRQSLKNQNKIDLKSSISTISSNQELNVFLDLLFYSQNVKLNHFTHFLNSSDSLSQLKIIESKTDLITKNLIRIYVSNQTIETKITVSNCLKAFFNYLLNFSEQSNALSKFIETYTNVSFNGSYKLTVQILLCSLLSQIFIPVKKSKKIPFNAVNYYELLLRSILSLNNTSSTRASVVAQKSFEHIAKLMGPNSFYQMIDYWQNSATMSSKFSSNQLMTVKKWSSKIFLEYEYQFDANELEDDEILDRNIPVDTGVSDDDSSEFDQDSDNFFESDQYSTENFDLYKGLTPEERSNSLQFLISSDLYLQLEMASKNNLDFQDENDKKILKAVQKMRDVIHDKLRKEDIQKKLLLEKSNQVEFIGRTQAMGILLSLFNGLVLDANFNVVLTSLEITTELCNIYNKFRIKYRKTQENDFSINPRLPNQRKKADSISSLWIGEKLIPIIQVALSDNKESVRIAGTKLALSMANFGPTGPMLIIRQTSLLLFTKSDPTVKTKSLFGTASARQTNIKLRSESIDLITTLMLKLPSHELDIPNICDQIIAPGLADRKIPVHLSALECLAVAAHLLVSSIGCRNLGSVWSAVEWAENNTKTIQADSMNESLIRTNVKNRLINKELPKLDSSNRLIYAQKSPLLMSPDAKMEGDLAKTGIPKPSPKVNTSSLPWGPNALARDSSFKDETKTLTDEVKSDNVNLYENIRSAATRRRAIRVFEEAEKRMTEDQRFSQVNLIEDDASANVDHEANEQKRREDISRSRDSLDENIEADSDTIKSIRQSILSKRRNKIQSMRSNEDQMMASAMYNSTNNSPNDPEEISTQCRLSKTATNRISLSKSRMSNSASNQALAKELPNHTDTMKRVMSTDCLLSQYDNEFKDQTMGSSSSDRLNTINECLHAIKQNDWESKILGLSSIEYLAIEKPQVLIGFSKTTSQSSSRTNSSTNEVLNQTMQGINRECKNLRSQVSKQAVHTLGKVYRHLPPKYTDAYLELTLLTLLSKIGEASSSFLKDEVMSTMETISECSTPIKVLQILLQHGTNHKNMVVRKFNAHYLANAVEKVGPTKLIVGHGMPISAGCRTNSSMMTISSAGSQSMTEKLFNAMSLILKDGNQETRSSGRRIVAVLHQNPDFDKVAQKYLTGESLRNVRAALENLSLKKS